MQTAELVVEGMTCNNCAMGVRRRLEKQGMEQVDVNFATGEVSFQNIPNLPITAIKESIEDLGYVVVQADEPNQQKKNF
jgi:Cu+-exporting ATPase